MRLALLHAAITGDRPVTEMEMRKVSFLMNEIKRRGFVIKRRGFVFWRESLREKAGISSKMLHFTPIFTPLFVASLPFSYFCVASFDL